MVRLKGFKKLTPVDEALRTFLDIAKIKKLGTAIIPLHQALHRVTAKDTIAREDLPRFDRSAVDGYAVRAVDTVGASQSGSRTLQISGAGHISAGQAGQVWTGNRVPKGADAVVMLENAKQVTRGLEVWGTVTPGENVSLKGEDVQLGDIIAKAGTRLKPQHLGIMAALGTTSVEVIEKPMVAILATGNELVEPGEMPSENQIFDSNRVVLSALCAESGADSTDLGIAQDNVDEICERLRLGLEKANLAITSGGTSVGGFDLVPEAVNQMGSPGVIVHGVAMRPGMPTALALTNGKPIVVLPGNPVAAMIGFEVFCKPLIGRFLGIDRVETGCVVKARMTRRIATTLGRRNFVRVRVFRRNEELLAEPISARGSSIISTMTRANAYVVVPENREGLEEEETVSVQLFDNIETVDANV